MKRATPLAGHLPSRHLATLWLNAQTSEQGRVWQALYMASQGHSITKIARETKSHRNSVRNWILAYNAQGPAFQPPVAKRPAPWRKQLG